MCVRTGATIDKCMIKVGMLKRSKDSLRPHQAAPRGCQVRRVCRDGHREPRELASLDRRLNLLADAIVHQNLSVLTRGNTLKHKVLLPAAPTSTSPLWSSAGACHPETWESRGHEYPKDVPIEEFIFPPENAEYYAAFGAVVFGPWTQTATPRSAPRA